MWAGVALVIVVALVLAILSLPKHGRRFTETFSDEPSQVVVSEKPVPVTPAMRRQVNATLVPFVASAVTRKDPVAAWELATAAMKSRDDAGRLEAGRPAGLPLPGDPGAGA